MRLKVRLLVLLLHSRRLVLVILLVRLWLLRPHLLEWLLLHRARPLLLAVGEISMGSESRSVILVVVVVRVVARVDIAGEPLSGVDGGPLRVRGRRVLQSVQVGGRVACVALLRGERRRWWWGTRATLSVRRRVLLLLLLLLLRRGSLLLHPAAPALPVRHSCRRRTGDGGVDLTINSQLRWGAPSGVSRSQSIPRVTTASGFSFDSDRRSQ